MNDKSKCEGCGKETEDLTETGDMVLLCKECYAICDESEEEIEDVEEEIETLKSLVVPLAKVAPLLRAGRRAEKVLARLKAKPLAP